jgi:hypothetical protein
MIPIEPTACAFEPYLSLPSAERTLLEAYRNHVGNPEAIKPSDTAIMLRSEAPFLM